MSWRRLSAALAVASALAACSTNGSASRGATGEAQSRTGDAAGGEIVTRSHQPALYMAISNLAIVEVASLELEGEAAAQNHSDFVVQRIRIRPERWVAADTAENLRRALGPQQLAELPTGAPPDGAKEEFLGFIGGNSSASIKAVVEEFSEIASRGDPVYALLTPGQVFDRTRWGVAHILSVSGGQLTAVRSPELQRDLETWQAHIGRPITLDLLATAMKEHWARRLEDKPPPLASDSVLGELFAAILPGAQKPPRWEELAPRKRGFSDPFTSLPEGLRERLVTKAVTVILDPNLVAAYPGSLLVIRNTTANVEVSDVSLGSRTRYVSLLPNEPLEVTIVLNELDPSSEKALATLAADASRGDTIVVTVGAPDGQPSAQISSCNTGESACPNLSPVKPPPGPTAPPASG